ncbi:hypothetical protein JCM17380_54980 [Desulfosporosinus burensis]
MSSLDRRCKESDKEVRTHRSGTGTSRISHFDLAMAVSLLQESGQILVDPEMLSDSAFIGELSLNAELRPVSGVLPMVIAARENGIKHLFVLGRGLILPGICREGPVPDMTPTYQLIV